MVFQISLYPTSTYWLTYSPMFKCLTDNIHKELGLLGPHDVEPQLLVDPGTEGDEAGE